MFPLESISSGTIDELFLYLAVLGILLLIGTALRLKVPFLKKYFIPASLIAGIIGLLLGPNVLNLIPKELINTWSALSGKLIVLVYAPLLMFKRKSSTKKVFKNGTSRILLNFGYMGMQYAVPLLMVVLFMGPLLGVPDLFGTIVEQGWAGGHGTAGGMGAVFEELKWADGKALSVTSATIGLLTGIIGGVVLINVAMRKGWSGVSQKTAGLENKTEELYTSETGKPAAIATVSSSVIDPMSFHLGLIAIAMLIGWFLTKLIKVYFNFSMSWFVTAMFGGLIVAMLLNKTKWGDAIDNATFNRIQGVSLDFLIAGSVASVNLTVVFKYALALLIQQGTMVVLMVLGVIWLGRRVYNQYWFENSIQLFGSFTGVTATGFMLLRTCDPEMKSDVLEVIAVSAPFTGWAIGGGMFTAIMPGLVVKYGPMNVGLANLALAIVCFAILRFFLWNKSEEHVVKINE